MMHVCFIYHAIDGGSMSIYHCIPMTDDSIGKFILNELFLIIFYNMYYGLTPH